jgi:UDP:flavonoid glycosyltransferase YjiC (YdhE family)
MKILLLPENNSLAHIIKCVAIQKGLKARGHETVLTTCKSRSPFLKGFGIKHHVLPDIQEADNAPLPTVNWFRKTECIVECVSAEVDLIKTEQPDRVLGVFRFTAKASAHIAGVPYDSLICGCMIPDSEEILGYSEREDGYEKQGVYLRAFYWYAAEKMNKALRLFGLNAIADIRELLKGERTFLWDFPEFMRLPASSDACHIGPIYWDNAFCSELLPDTGETEKTHKHLAIVSFGTGCISARVVKRIVNILLEMDYRVVLAAGGQNDLFVNVVNHPNLSKYLFAGISNMLPFADLVISHGGQMTVFEALRNRVPVMVMPFQPEQLHNGLCLERIGCGARLIVPEPFMGNSDVYIDAFNRTTDAEIKHKLEAIVNCRSTAVKLANYSQILKKYSGVDKLAELI